MITIRRADEIHAEDGGWFHARWHFSFGGYHDPEQLGVGALRVFNDDRLVAGADWPMHPHRDIESLTYVVEGEFAHADSLGNGGNLGPGGAQVMRFGSRGADHSERNASDDEPLRFLQFWILPSESGLESSVQQHQFTAGERMDRWLTIMSAGPDGLELAQDATVKVSRLSPGTSLDHRFAAGRGGYVYVIDGTATLDGQKASSGDAATIGGAHELTIGSLETTELILIDVPLDFRPVGIWAARR